jgi:hypothetical protein
MQGDPEFLFEPGGFEPFDRFSADEAEEIDHPERDDFDAFTVNL